MRFLIIPLAILAFLSIAPQPATAQSQAEMNMEAGKRLEKADAELNKIYKQVLAQRTKEPGFTAVLKEAQRAWLKFLDHHMNVLFYVEEGENPREVYGSIYPLEFAEAKTALIEARIAQLKDLLAE